MQAPDERQRLISLGRFAELEPPQELGWGDRAAPPASRQQLAHAILRPTVIDREPGEDDE